MVPLDVPCPRCGYDQRGVAASWHEQCPLEGQCAECGLHFEWRELLNPLLVRPRWCIEFAEARRLPVAAFRTFAMMLSPRRFWRELKMIHSPRWRPFMWLMAPLALVLYLTFAISVGHAVWRNSTMAATSGAALRLPPLLAGARAAALPWSARANNLAGGWETPRYFASTYEPRLATVFYQSLRRGTPLMPYTTIPALAAHGTIATLSAPLGFVLLPVSRRVCRVRWRHIARIWLYSFPCLLPLILLDMFAQVSGLPRGWSTPAAVVMLCVSLGLLTRWWATATTHYLRMPHGLAVGAAVIAVGYAIVMFVMTTSDLAADLLQFS